MADYQRICSVDGCNNPHYGKGYCGKHWQRFCKKRKPAKGRSPSQTTTWLHEHAGWRGDECLIWPFARGRAGYGNVYYEGAYTNAHRAMCVIANGEPPTPEHQAAHSCGNGHLGCVHPEHLRWATRLENETDKLIHGTVRQGEDVPTSKLTEHDVRRIRSSTSRVNELAREFGVGHQQISRIRRGERWAWLK